LVDLGKERGIILKWILNWVQWCGVESSGSGQGLAVGYCKYGNETLDSIKGTEFLQHQSRRISEESFCSILFTGASKQDL
jgi:hypothetical protein